MTAALSRFGTWSNLKITASSHTDVVPRDPHLQLPRGHLHQPVPDLRRDRAVQQRPGVGQRLHHRSRTRPRRSRRSSPSTAARSTSPAPHPGRIGFPFVNISNVALISGASYNPGILAGLSWTDIASGLNDPTNPVTQAIVATANYISAAICASTKNAAGLGVHELRGQGRRQGPEARADPGPEEPDRAHAAMAAHRHPAPEPLRPRGVDLPDHHPLRASTPWSARTTAPSTARRSPPAPSRRSSASRWPCSGWPTSSP